MAASDSTSFCLDGMTCAPLLLTSCFGSRRRRTESSSGTSSSPTRQSGAGSLKIVHIYDPVITSQANLATKL